MHLTLDVHPAAPGTMPDADTDVLIWIAGDREATLGAYVGHDDDGAHWQDAHGGRVQVAAWAELPLLTA